MNYHILTLFPEMVTQGLSESILGRAAKKGLLSVNAAGGGAVEVTVSGKHEITKVKLSPEVVDPDDIEMLEDLIMAATNEAYRQLDEFSQSSMAKITGGMGGLGGMPF